MSSSDQTDGSQQLQHQGLGPVAEDTSDDDVTGTRIHVHTHTHTPVIPAVQTERDLIDATRVRHDQVETRLKQKHDQSRYRTI